MGCTSTAGTAQDWKIGEFDRAPLLHVKTLLLVSNTQLIYRWRWSLDSISRLCDRNELKSEKLESLKRTLVEKRKLKGVSFRCIVFVKQRIAAYILAKHLNSDTTCKDYGMRAGFVAAKKSKITPSIKVTPGDASRCIEQFRSGDINILVATAVIEEVSLKLSVWPWLVMSIH